MLAFIMFNQLWNVILYAHEWCIGSPCLEFVASANVTCPRQAEGINCIRDVASVAKQVSYNGNF
jgi:hypothetical protein